MNAVELPTFILGAAAAIAGVAAIAGGKDWKFRGPAAVLCAVLILGAVVLAVTTPWTGVADTAGSRPPTTTTTAPVTTTTTTTTEPPTTTTTALDDDETELLASLNTDDGAFDPDSCEEGETGDNGDVEFVAIISCDAYGLENDLWVSEFPDRQNYVKFFRKVSGEMTNQGLCGVVQQSSVPWSRDGVTIGNLVCYPAGNKQWFVWFCANTQTVASASAADLASLYAWWNSYAYVLPCP